MDWRADGPKAFSGVGFRSSFNKILVLEMSSGSCVMVFRKSSLIDVAAVVQHEASFRLQPTEASSFVRTPRRR